MDDDCSSAPPDALYGCGAVTGVWLGLGLAGARTVRIETLVDRHPRFTFEGRANLLAPERWQSVSIELSVLSGMVAAHIDLHALDVSRLGPFDLFAGGGIGAARIRIGEKWDERLPPPAA